MDNESPNSKVDVDKVLSDTVKELEVLVSIYRRRGWRGEAARIRETIDQFSQNGSSDQQAKLDDTVDNPGRDHGLSANHTTDLSMRRDRSQSSNSSSTGT